MATLSEHIDNIRRAIYDAQDDGYQVIIDVDDAPGDIDIYSGVNYVGTAITLHTTAGD